MATEAPIDTSRPDFWDKTNQFVEDGEVNELADFVEDEIFTRTPDGKKMKAPELLASRNPRPPTRP